MSSICESNCFLLILLMHNNTHKIYYFMGIPEFARRILHFEIALTLQKCKTMDGENCEKKEI